MLDMPSENPRQQTLMPDDMKPSSTPAQPLLWETARSLYDTVRTQEEKASADRESAAAEVLQQIQGLMKAMISELREPPQGIITHAARQQFKLTVAAQSQGEAETPDVLMPGDIRLVSPRFLPGVDRPLAVLLLDQNFETDEWVVVPFSPENQAVRNGEWETQLEEPLLHVLCFWNARTVQGCVLEESQAVDSLNADELEHCDRLYRAWTTRQPWSLVDAARSAAPLRASLDPRQDYVDREREMLDGLVKVRAFRPSNPEGASALLASSSVDAWHPYEQNYVLPGFGRRLSMRSIAAGIAEVTLSNTAVTHAASLVSPVLVTGVGTEYPLQEGRVVSVPARELTRGFWVSVGDYGWTSLVAVHS